MSRLPMRSTSAENGVCLVLVVGLALRVAWPAVWTDEHVDAWATIFGAMCLQACPFVVLGVVLSALVLRFPPGAVGRLLPRSPVAAVPIAAVAAAAIPGCECGSVSLASTLMRRGVATGPSIAVMLSGPATNPIVLVATATAYPGQHAVVAARLATSLSAAVVVGWLTARVPRSVRPQSEPDHRHRPSDEVVQNLVHNLALLTCGAAAAASFTLLVPATVVTGLGGQPLVALPVMAGLAVVLGVCSSADAFIAASFTGFTSSAQLVFMTVGPVVDVKLIAMQIGTFGARRAVPLALTTFVITVLCAAVWSAVLL